MKPPSIPKLQLVDERRIWDAAPHCAFTDLIQHRDELFLSFREGLGHLSVEGALRVLRSADGEDWTSCALIRLAGHDLRDPSISVMPNGSLMLVAGVAERLGDGEGTRHGTGTAVCFSPDGSNWTEPEVVVDPGRWIWRVAWSGATAYGFAYGGSSDGGEDTVISLMRSRDGRDWEVQVDEALAVGCPSEVSLRFGADGKAYALARRGSEPGTAALGTSHAPYDDWNWRDLDRYLGGPCLIDAGSAGWLAAGRVFDANDAARTQLLALDLESGTLAPMHELQSGGDTSYPGLVRDGDTLFASYYSTHEEQTCIYLARLRLDGEH